MITKRDTLRGALMEAHRQWKLTGKLPLKIELPEKGIVIERPQMCRLFRRIGLDAPA